LANPQEDEEWISMSKNAIKTSSNFLNKSSKRTLLLMPSNTKDDIFILNKYNEKYKKLKSRREDFKEELSIKKLIEFYINALEEDKKIKYGSVLQLSTALGYEKSVLFYLRKDLEKNNFLDKEKQLLIKSIEKLFLFDTFYLYQLITIQNKYYFKNIKKYIDLMQEEPTKYMIYNEKTYQEFLFYLKRGEDLSLKGILSNNFEKFEKFIKNELKMTDKERSLLKESMLKNTTKTSILYTAYWIRMRVYINYIGKANIYLGILNQMEEQQEFFKNLKK